jgi:2,4-dienoyl-CoA reductase-like NADH-dependent reductase (Old Yellow Enzyme family)/thioredoxin reductase
MGSIVDPDRKMNWYADLDFCHDKFVPALSLLADEAHKYGAKISYEVCHSGRGFLPSMENEGDAGGITDEDPVPDAMATTGNLMTREDMDWMKDRFIRSCLRAKKAGFDIIFVHVGHNNLLGTFLSPSTNTRTDEYGGGRENRMRYPLEVVKAIREAIGPDMPIEMRISADEMTKDGSKLEDAVAFLQLCEPYIDLAHFSNGNVFHVDSRIYTSPMYTMEHKINVKYAAEAKKALKIPVLVVGNIYTLQDAEDIIAAGQADMVGYCRSLLADPELVVKSTQDREDDVRPCLRCMDGCGVIFAGLPARCAINPQLGYETEVRQLQDATCKKKVMVIGGGPAGMQAALTASARGHEVTLYEQGEKLGGRLHDASLVSFKDLMRNYYRWIVRETEKSGAKIVLNTQVTKELVEQEKPDAVFVATGSEYIRPPIQGIDGRHVHMLSDVENKRVSVGNKVIVCGGGLSGIESAVDLARAGHDVTVIDMIPTEDFCKDMFFFAYEALFKEVRLAGVKLQGDSRIVAFNERGVLIERGGKTEQMEADDCIIALGLAPVDELAWQLYTQNPMSTFIIGDASRVKNIRNATRMAFDGVLAMEAFCE